ncbi:MAG: hypothetical protein AB7V18_10565 [Pyrinomonadaceae bacterium]
MRSVLKVGVWAALLLACPALYGQTEVSIANIQGSKNLSEYVDQQVKVSGIVTARLRNGFFLQTADAKADADPLTSEGIFVFTRTEPMAEAVVGSEVSVAGKVEEFRARQDAYGLTITEISHFIGRDAFSVISRGNPLPKPITLKLSDIKANSPDQFERFEGMRVFAEEMLSVAPTGGRVDGRTETVVSDGVFYAVLKGSGRPFREPGMAILQYLGSPDKDKWKKELPSLPIFDGNPEVLRIETLAQAGSAALDVSAKAQIMNVSGVMHYAFGRYAILTDASPRPVVTSSIKPVAMPLTTAGQFSVASANIETFVDDVDDPDVKEDVAASEAFEKRLGKISVAFRDYLQMPDVISIVEAENLNVLKKLAARLNADAAAAGKPDPKYEAYLFEGNDPRGIDCGFLVKTSRVSVKAAKQFGKGEQYKNPVTGKTDALNDRPPIMLEIAIADPAAKRSIEFTIVSNHLKSFRGADDPEDGANVRMKKKLQAEFLAKWVNDRQAEHPRSRILLVGDFNAFAFNDGLVDQIGTIIGKPAAKDSVLLSSPDLVDPDLIDLVNLIKADERYSFTFDGNAQVLDHFIATQEMRKHLAGFGYLRVNADYPQVLRGVAGRPERFSDHDVAVGYFTIDERK